MRPVEAEQTCLQHREPFRIAGPAALWLVFYAAVIAGALWHAHDSSLIARLSPEQARAAAAQTGRATASGGVFGP